MVQCVNSLTAGEQLNSTVLYIDGTAPPEAEQTMLQIKSELIDVLQNLQDVEFKIRCEHGIGDELPRIEGATQVDT